ncbi:zinc-ribbon domain-containing protein [Peribacillus simplex]|uniref:zinc-ribbon domain-containing protein n=1 Tax=Peribacillus simplex TaxID=1478 RepID=UPI003672A579
MILIVFLVQVVPGAGKKVWWRCSKHPKHEFPARITDRNDGRRCPYCKNRKVCETNNLSVVNLSLAAEWHPTKYGDLTPYFTFLTFFSLSALLMENRILKTCQKNPALIRSCSFNLYSGFCTITKVNSWSRNE